MDNTLAIFIPDLLHYETEKLNTILSNIKQQYTNKDDYLIFTDFFTINPFQHWGILSTFYMKFFKGTVIFLNEQDYSNNQNETLATCFLHKEV